MPLANVLADWLTHPRWVLRWLHIWAARPSGPHWSAQSHPGPQAEACLFSSWLSVKEGPQRSDWNNMKSVQAYHPSQKDDLNWNAHSSKSYFFELFLNVLQIKKGWIQFVLELAKTQIQRSKAKKSILCYWTSQGLTFEIHKLKCPKNLSVTLQCVSVCERERVDWSLDECFLYPAPWAASASKHHRC